MLQAQLPAIRVVSSEFRSLRRNSKVLTPEPSISKIPKKNQFSYDIVVSTSENGEVLCIRAFQFFLSVFHAKSGTANNPRNGSNDISH